MAIILITALLVVIMLGLSFLSYLSENNLLDDIAEQAKFIDNNIIIVVTGDLIHKGNYEYEASVLKFFRTLSKIIGDKFQDIYIVPGNHDKERNAIDKMILEKYVFTANDSTARKFKAKYWQYISYAFNKHLKLVKNIYKIFYKKISLNT